MEPTNWNVVVRASWNLAILTPSGIAQRLFGLSPGTPVEVQVPLDGRHPYQVHHDGLVVVATEDELLIEPDVSDFENLARARALGSRALELLPETPCSAAGFNLRYKAERASDVFIELLDCQLDLRLSELGHELEARRRGATWNRGEGRVNMEASVEGVVGRLTINFHRSSNEPNALRRWLDTPNAEIQALADSITHLTSAPTEQAGRNINAG